MPCSIHALEISSRRLVRTSRQSHSHHPFGEPAKHTLRRMTVRRTTTPEQAEYDKAETHPTAEGHREPDSRRRHFAQEICEVACLQFCVVPHDPHVPTMLHRLEQIHHVA